MLLNLATQMIKMPKLAFSSEVLIATIMLAIVFFTSYYAMMKRNQSKKVKGVVVEDENDQINHKLSVEL
jgi:hypothetical protein